MLLVYACLLLLINQANHKIKKSQTNIDRLAFVLLRCFFPFLLNKNSLYSFNQFNPINFIVQVFVVKTTTNKHTSVSFWADSYTQNKRKTKKLVHSMEEKSANGEKENISERKA